MKRCLRVLGRSILLSLMNHSEYRSNFVVWSAVNLGWSLYTLAFFLIVYSRSSVIAGWDVHQMLLLLGTYNLLGAFIYGFLYSNFRMLTQSIISGEMDNYLTKPIDSQFFVSTRYFGMNSVPSALIGIVLLVVGIKGVGGVALTDVALYLVMFLAALVLTYSVWFITVTLAFWFEALRNVYELYNSLRDFSRLPSEFYPAVVGNLLMFVVPLVIVTTVPAKALLGIAGPLIMAYLLFIAGVFLWLSHKFWNFSLRQYSSASS